MNNFFGQRQLITENWANEEWILENMTFKFFMILQLSFLMSQVKNLLNNNLQNSD